MSLARMGYQDPMLISFLRNHLLRKLTIRKAYAQLVSDVHTAYELTHPSRLDREDHKRGRRCR